MPETLTVGHPFLRRVVEALDQTYGARLASVAVFGSVARGSARPDSDLDLFVVVDGLPPSRRARLRTFDAVEQHLAAALRDLARRGVHTRLAPLLRTPDEAVIATPLMLDLTEDAVMLVDRDGLLATALAALRTRLARAGARRIWRGTQWYWDLKPDFRRGDIVRI
ncbi:MAG: nucleotidyltransferase domain-containing protein [bacterium]|nr:nucleotidyltransferase domain-containing protein [bacterium]